MNEKGGGNALWGAKRILNVLRGALPHCPFEMADFSINKGGEPTLGVWRAYIEGAEAVCGLAQGRIIDRIEKEVAVEESGVREALVDEAVIWVQMLREVKEARRRITIISDEVEKERRWITDDPAVVFEEAFDYYDALDLKFRVVVPARVLFPYLEKVEEKAGGSTIQI